MPCTPKKTLDLVIESGNDYLVVVKKNQKHLHCQLETIAKFRQSSQEHQQQEKNRGRFERRTVRIFPVAGLNDELCPQAATMVAIERFTIRKGKESCTTTYYLSSLSTHAERWQSLIRGHWSIENRLHWSKDVVLKEDSSYGRNANALLNASLFRTIVINLLRLNGMDSLSFALRGLANQVESIFRLLT